MVKQMSRVELIIMDRVDWFNEYHCSRLIIVTLVIPLSSLDSIGREEQLLCGLPTVGLQDARVAAAVHSLSYYLEAVKLILPE